jgi:hypothetical protein
MAAARRCAYRRSIGATASRIPILHRFPKAHPILPIPADPVPVAPKQAQNVVRRSSNGNVFAGRILRWMSRKPYESGMFLQHPTC